MLLLLLLPRSSPAGSVEPLMLLLLPLLLLALRVLGPLSSVVGILVRLLLVTGWVTLLLLLLLVDLLLPLVGLLLLLPLLLLEVVVHVGRWRERLWSDGVWREALKRTKQ